VRAKNAYKKQSCGNPGRGSPRASRCSRDAGNRQTRQNGEDEQIQRNGSNRQPTAHVRRPRLIQRCESIEDRVH
jgi:hypothetical protein